MKLEDVCVDPQPDCAWTMIHNTTRLIHVTSRAAGNHCGDRSGCYCWFYLIPAPNSRLLHSDDDGSHVSRTWFILFCVKRPSAAPTRTHSLSVGLVHDTCCVNKTTLPTTMLLLLPCFVCSIKILRGMIQCFEIGKKGHVRVDRLMIPPLLCCGRYIFQSITAIRFNQ